MATTRKISSAEWDSHKAKISALYLEENLTLDEVGRRMEDKHGFSARSVIVSKTTTGQTV